MPYDPNEDKLAREQARQWYEGERARSLAGIKDQAVFDAGYNPEKRLGMPGRIRGGDAFGVGRGTGTVASPNLAGVAARHYDTAFKTGAMLGEPASYAGGAGGAAPIEVIRGTTRTYAQPEAIQAGGFVPEYATPTQARQASVKAGRDELILSQLKAGATADQAEAEAFKQFGEGYRPWGMTTEETRRPGRFDSRAAEAAMKMLPVVESRLALRYGQTDPKNPEAGAQLPPVLKSMWGEITANIDHPEKIDKAVNRFNEVAQEYETLNTRDARARMLSNLTPEQMNDKDLVTKLKDTNYRPTTMSQYLSLKALYNMNPGTQPEGQLPKGQAAPSGQVGRQEGLSPQHEMSPTFYVPPPQVKSNINVASPIDWATRGLMELTKPITPEEQERRKRAIQNLYEIR